MSTGDIVAAFLPIVIGWTAAGLLINDWVRRHPGLAADTAHALACKSLWRIGYTVGYVVGWVRHRPRRQRVPQNGAEEGPCDEPAAPVARGS
jgi:hypothetical protein